MTNQSIQEVTTGKVRLSFVHLFAPHASKQGEEPKYSATILVPKTDIATKQKIDAAINAAIQLGVSSKWNGVRPPVLAIPVYDGDGVRPSDGMPFGEECKGHWVFSASSRQAPEIVDVSLQRILSQSEVYSGIYARASIKFYPYASNGKKGIGCGLGPVQKLEDGEPLGGRVSAASAFGDSSGGYSTALAQAPIYTQQPTTYPQQSQVYPQQPVYNPQVPAYAPQPVTPQQLAFVPQTLNPQQSVYQQPSYGQPMQQTYAAASQPMDQPQTIQIDPITGAPVNGGVMGI